ncbi:YggT family protein [Candidatus Liberibacter americanus]|uniref:Uncharacterized protein n=1 Tax=Candidatus Liberibacter americanus str. Sao Paulo TaxID=1261131 RepID=U6B5I3_9HYPH|nr:hypothetical protein lam_913 [Candidatus Liberibacter americanus str. Sao Paulo]EMS36241.1 hypothetical protein G653_02409 [Candidatus Liberibacter americanus PW_SP]
MNITLKIIYIILTLYEKTLLIRFIFSFLYDYNVFNTSNSLVNLIRQFLFKITDPLLNLIRQNIPIIKQNFGYIIDLSPLLALIIIYTLQYLLNNMIYWDVFI